MAIASWKALLDALHSVDIIPKQEGQGGHYRSPYVFRGMSCSDWPVKTSLERLDSEPTKVELPLLRSFRKYAPRGMFASNSDWEALSVGQHNGLPTRLLDWSVSPLIAAHFATCERQYFKEDAIIWAVDVIALNNQILPAEVVEPIQRNHAAIFDVDLLETAYPRLRDFDATHEKFKDVCVFFEPPSIDARIANQTGLLSAMNGADVSHDAYLKGLETSHPGVVHRFVIAKEAKQEIRDMLDQDNIHERMLFPGLPGLCDWLKRYYGPA